MECLTAMEVIAYVTAVNEDGTVNVRYTIKRSKSFNVLPERIHSASLAVSARCRSPDEATRPSLLSPHHSPMVWNSLEGRRQQRGRAKHYKPIADVLSENRSWNNHCSEENPLMAYLRDERKKNDKGWLRLRERENAGLPAVALNKQLETTEKTMVVNVMSAFDGVQVPEGSHPMSDLAYGMAKNPRSLKYVYERFLNNNFSNERKERSDKGNNIFNSQKKRNATFTTLNAFKKARRAESRGEHFSDKELKAVFDGLSPNERRCYEVMAEGHLQQSSFLVENIQKVLLKTNGRIAWRRLAAQISGSSPVQIISYWTIMKFVMSLPDSCYQTTRILPKLDK